MEQKIKRPQVLFLGNGINKCNGGDSWNEFLSKTSYEETRKWIEDKSIPMPLKAILVSKNQINQKLKNLAKDLMPNKVLQQDNVKLSSLLQANFDAIITTNYTYEIEQACNGGAVLSESVLKKHTKNFSPKGKAEQKYLLHTFNQFEYAGQEQKIWHIHGEARKPNSMILGHYYYGNLCGRIKNYLDGKSNSYKWFQDRRIGYNIKSWIDYFILGDVYILGQGLDFSELDLWWLINRKKNEKADVGKIYFFEPYKKSEEAKIFLLESLNVQTNVFGSDKTNQDYIEFYNKAISKVLEIKAKASG